MTDEVTIKDAVQAVAELRKEVALFSPDKAKIEKMNALLDTHDEANQNQKPANFHLCLESSLGIDHRLVWVLWRHRPYDFALF